MFHVTKRENAKRVWENGVQPRAPDAQWVDERQEMRQVLDEVGNEHYSNWVNREGALFFWPTFDAAYRYADRLLEPAIVEVHLENPDAWAISNTTIEVFFDDYMNYRTQHSDEEIREYAAQVIEEAQLWNGQRDDDLEVWLQSAVPASAVHRIVDRRGEPLDL